MTSPEILPARGTGDYLVDAGVPQLLDQHRAMLDASAISPEVMAARGYTSVLTRKTLQALNFSREQCKLFPALLIPTFRPSGAPGIVQIRPDEPRTPKGARQPNKYEMAAGESLCLDVPPTVRQHIGDPKIPLYITEGVKKGDALASAGACVVALLGVTCWKGTNEQGGKTVLPDWHEVALAGREIRIVFDSDIMRKLPVYQALKSLREWLRSKGATVYQIYLPEETTGVKVGVDDFLATGKTLDDLQRLTTADLLPPPSSPEIVSPYRETPQGLVWNRPTRDGVSPTLIANFTARIVAEVILDDGVDKERQYRIHAERETADGKKRIPEDFLLPVSQFNAMQWPSMHLGSFASVSPGLAAMDHARYAIRILSGEPEEEYVLTHTGWHEVDGKWVYLHGGGHIGPPAANVSVQLPDAFALFTLPEPPEEEDLVAAIEATLALLDPDFAPEALTFPLLAGVFHAALTSADFSLALIGRTMTYKTELAALFQRFFGPDMDAKHLPAHWLSTQNALGELAFLGKDVLLTIDDFVPKDAEAAQLHAKAEAVLRAAGNGSGRQRLRRDGGMRAARPPRGLILITGEDVPIGQSLRARLLILDVATGDVKRDALSVRQQAAAAGRYAETLAAFLAWVAPCYPDAVRSFRQNALHYRDQAQQQEKMRRTPDIVGHLLAALEIFLKFVAMTKVRTQEETAALRDRAWKALLEGADAQSAHQADSDPTQRFLEMLRGAVAGGRAHLAGPKGSEPPDPRRWGWRRVGPEDSEWEKNGERIGYVEGEDVYLIPEIAFTVASRLSRENGEQITLTARMLWTRMKEAGLLIPPGKPKENKWRKTLEGKPQQVLYLTAETFLGGAVTEEV